MTRPSGAIHLAVFLRAASVTSGLEYGMIFPGKIVLQGASRDAKYL